MCSYDIVYDFRKLKTCTLFIIALDPFKLKVPFRQENLCVWVVNGCEWLATCCGDGVGKGGMREHP